MSDEKKQLWEEYMKAPTMELREKIILEYAGLVKIVAGRLSMYLGYTVEYDDLVGYGIFGLIDAIDKFDYKKGVKFETYATLRIRGAILDQIRKMDWLPRTIRQKQKKIDAALQKISLQSGKEATMPELADELGISMDELEEWQNQTQLNNVVSLEEYLEQGTEIRMNSEHNAQFEQPEHLVEQQELRSMLIEALDCLTENEKKVITLYYYEEMTLKEISLILDVSESRISQLHTKALKKMQKKMGPYMGIFPAQ
jgi:RNA polymerase sigma factor for flagellar operon FliA